jgi:hypothetical protein
MVIFRPAEIEVTSGVPWLLANNNLEEALGCQVAVDLADADRPHTLDKTKVASWQAMSTWYAAHGKCSLASHLARLASEALRNLDSGPKRRSQVFRLMASVPQGLAPPERQGVSLTMSLMISMGTGLGIAGWGPEGQELGPAWQDAARLQGPANQSWCRPCLAAICHRGLNPSGCKQQTADMSFLLRTF